MDNRVVPLCLSFLTAGAVSGCTSSSASDGGISPDSSTPIDVAAINDAITVFDDGMEADSFTGDAMTDSGQETGSNDASDATSGLGSTEGGESSAPPRTDAGMPATGIVCNPPVQLDTTSHAYTGDLTGMTVGLGFNPLSSSLATTCVQGPPNVPTCNGAGSQTFRMQFIQDSSSLKTSLGLAANASYDSGIYSGEASASFFRSSEVQSDSAYLFLETKVNFDAQALASAQLTPSALALLQNDPEAFVASCGSEYASSITRGGMYRAIYVFHSLSSREVSELSSSFNVAGPNFSAGGSLQQSLEKATSHYDFSVYVAQSGGRLAQVGLTPSELIARARNFGAAAPDGSMGDLNCTNASPIAVQMRPYYSVTNFPAGVRYPNLTQQINELADMADSWDQITVLQNDLRARVRRPGNLASTQCATDQAAINAKAAEIDTFYRTAKAKRDACYEVHLCGPSAACLQTLTLPATSLPRLTDPVHCGPACTDGSMSTYLSDDRGYCTRCTWTWPPVRTSRSDEDVDYILRSNCRYMRPGARVTLQMHGRIAPPCSPVSSGGQMRYTTGSGLPVIIAPFEAWRLTGQGGWNPVSIQSQMDLDPRTAPTEATTWLLHSPISGPGGGCQGLNFNDFIVDICDADRPGGCALPPM